MIIIKTDWGFLNLPTDSYFDFMLKHNEEGWYVLLNIEKEEEDGIIITVFEKEEDAKQFLENLFEMIKRHEPNKVLSFGGWTNEDWTKINSPLVG